MASSVPSENIIKLRMLSDELCKTQDDEYKVIVKKLKLIIENGKKDIEELKTPTTKFKCYESMCSSITTLLNSVNF